MGFIRGHGFVLDATGDDEELAGFKVHHSIAKVKIETSFQDQEQFVFGIVVVPDKFAFDLHQLDVLAVEFADDSRRPSLAELRQLVCEIDLLHSGAFRR